MRVYLSDAFFEFEGNVGTCWIYRGDEKFRVRASLNGFAVYRHKLRQEAKDGIRSWLVGLASLTGFKRDTKDNWDLVGCMSFSVDGRRPDDRLLDNGTMVRSWDNTLEPPVRIDIGECKFRPSSWPSFRFRSSKFETWIVLSEDRVGLKYQRSDESGTAIRKILNLEGVDRYSMGTLVDWREVLWRRYGTDIGFWLERKIDNRIKRHADSTVNSIRFCDVTSSIEHEEFNRLRSCCMSFEQEIEHSSGKRFRIGFNYGH